MYKAFEMYPKLKMEIVGKIREMEKEIRNKEQTIEEIKAIGASKKMQVARLLSERRIQKQKVKELRDLFDLDK